MPDERFEERSRSASGHDDAPRADIAVVEDDVSGAPAEFRPLGGGPLEDLRAAIGRRGGQADGRAVWIDRGAIPSTNADSGLDSGVSKNRLRVQRRRVETGFLADLLFPFELRGLFRSRRGEQRRAWLELTLHVETAKERGEIERGAPP